MAMTDHTQTSKQRKAIIFFGWTTAPHLCNNLV